MVAVLMLRSEEEPILSLCSDCFPLLQIRAERGDAGPRSHHDDWRVAVLRQTELRSVWKNGDRCFLRAFRQKCAANAFALATATFVMHHVDGEVHLIGMRLQARGDR